MTNLLTMLEESFRMVHLTEHKANRRSKQPNHHILQFAMGGDAVTQEIILCQAYESHYLFHKLLDQLKVVSKGAIFML